MKPVALPLVLLALALPACGDDDSSDGGGPRIVATTTQLADIAREVAGPGSVKQILPPGADPHDYEPRPSDARALENADVILRSGGDLDDWLDDLVDGADADARVVDALAASGGGEDPHWWQDPRNAARVVTALSGALDDAGFGRSRQSAPRYRDRLARLDRSVAACVARLPAAKRKLVTTHDAFGRYADRYGLEVIGAVIPSLSSQAQPSSKDVARLVGLIRDEDVEAIFPESSLDSKLERAIARETGATVGGRLWADSLGPEGSPGATDLGAIASNTREIVKGLSGGAVSCRPRA